MVTVFLDNYRFVDPSNRQQLPEIAETLRVQVWRPDRPIANGSLPEQSISEHSGGFRLPEFHRPRFPSAWPQLQISGTYGFGRVQPDH